MKTTTLENLPWGPPRELETKRGRRVARSLYPSHLQLEDYRAHPENWPNVTVSTWQGRVQMTWWQMPTPEAEGAASAEIAASQAHDAEIAIPVPDGLSLMPFQRAGVAYAHRRTGTLVGDSMGLGKTIQALACMNLWEVDSALIVCPASLKLNWAREAEKWLLRNPRITISDGTKWRRIRDGDFPVVIVNYDVAWREPISTDLRKKEWGVIVCDEAHFCKNIKSKRAAAVFGSRSMTPLRTRRKLALTGTPIPNRPVEAFPILKWLDPVTWGNWKYFTSRYCDAKPGFGQSMDVSGASNLPELRDKLRKTVMVRREKEDVLTELPEKRRQIVELECPRELKLLLDRETQEFRLHEEEIQALRKARGQAVERDYEEFKLASSGLEGGITAHFAVMSKLRSEIAALKVPLVVRYVEDLLENEDKILIGAHHKSMVSGLMDALGKYGAVKVVGGDDIYKRQAAVDEFQNGKARVFVGNIIAAGTGLTLTKAAEMVMAEVSWVPSELAQIEDRIHRIGQTRSVLIHYLVCEGSLDATMLRKVAKKLDVSDTALGKGNVESPQIPTVEPEPSRRPEPAQPVVCRLTPRQLEAAERVLRIVAGMNTDRASVRNGVGFSKFDSTYGDMLARTGRAEWSPRMAISAHAMATKYRRQAPEEAENL